MSFNEILEAADHLSLDEQASLLEVLQHRLVERRREARAPETFNRSRREFETDVDGSDLGKRPADILKEYCCRNRLLLPSSALLARSSRNAWSQRDPSSGGSDPGRRSGELLERAMRSPILS